MADLLEHGHEPPTVVGRVRPGLEQFLQRVPLDQPHGQERAAVRQGAQVVDGRDARVLEPAGDPGLVGEPAGGPGVGGEPVGQHLDRHLAAQNGVGRPVDDAHCPPADIV
jgi:hypothetical protein